MKELKNIRNLKMKIKRIALNWMEARSQKSEVSLFIILLPTPNFGLIYPKQQ